MLAEDLPTRYAAAPFEAVDTCIYQLRGDAVSREYDCIDAPIDIVERCIHDPVQRWIIERLYQEMQMYARWVGVDYAELYHEAEASHQKWIAFDAHREAIKHERLRYRARVDRFNIWSVFGHIVQFDPKQRRRSAWRVPVPMPHERERTYTETLSEAGNESIKPDTKVAHLEPTQKLSGGSVDTLMSYQLKSHAQKSSEPRFDYTQHQGGSAPRHVNGESYRGAIDSLMEHNLLYPEWGRFSGDPEAVRRGALFPTRLLILRLHIAVVFWNA